MVAQILSSSDFQHFTFVLAFQYISTLSQIYLQDFNFFFAHCVQRKIESFEWLSSKKAGLNISFFFKELLFVHCVLSFFKEGSHIFKDLNHFENGLIESAFTMNVKVALT